jgi:hypothetical protein
MLLAGFVCFVSVFVSATSISITGGFIQQNGQNTGDFEISGPGIDLIQRPSPDGPSSFGDCTVGSVCTFYGGVGSLARFCSYCLGLSSGGVGNKSADFLDGGLNFTGSAFYSGTSSLNMPLTIAGTIIGYALVNCNNDGTGCSLGAQEFRVRIVAQGTGLLTMQPTGTTDALIRAVYVSNMTGTATVVPEPMSLVLTGTGLAGVWIRRKIAPTK